jgi:4-amino-4-deoxy-L-arabinose transferase-like glycosyltransferase
MDISTDGPVQLVIDVNEVRTSVKNKVWRLFALIGVALGLRLLFGLEIVGSMPLMSDAASYSGEAEALLQSFPGEEPYYWPPGLPYLLAVMYSLFGKSIVTARMLAIGISKANVFLADRLAHAVLTENRVARLAGWIMAVYPPSILMTSQTLSQPLEMTAVLAAAICAVEGMRSKQWIWGLGAGAALGFGVLVRSSLVSVVAGMAATGLVLSLRRFSFLNRGTSSVLRKATLVGLAAACVVCGPVLLHNYSTGGGMTVSTNNHRNLFLGNNPFTPIYKTNHLASTPRAELPDRARAYLRSFENAPDPRQSMVTETLTYISRHPLETIVRTTSRIRQFWGFDYVTSRRIQVVYDLGMPAFLGVLLLEAGGYVLVVCLALTGLTEPTRYRVGALLLIGLLVFFYQVPYWIAFSSGTYHYTVIGLLVPLAAAGATRWISWWNREEPLPSGRLLVALFTGFALLQLEYAYFLYAYSPFGN